MSITSFQFIALFGVSLLLYYVVPLKFRWIALLLYSLCFFYLSSPLWTIVYIIANAMITYVSSICIHKAWTDNNKRRANAALLLGILGDVGILAVLKYSNFVIINLNAIVRLFGKSHQFSRVELQSPIGISFYTIISLGYLLDCYWKIVEPQKNPFKTALFIGYFPQLTSGPITRYSQMQEQLYIGKKFSYKNVSFGCQRILWGFFKKIVISSRVAIIVDGIYTDPEQYAGLYIWIAAALFMLQLYTDFSGCMDIIIGASECYGIVLPENFRTPFFSTSVQEYWQRWHITLGSWLKDYIMYPILRADAMKKFTKWLKEKVGKKASRQIPSYLAMLCVWLLIGLWHGGAYKYILGMGLWFWACIVLNQVLQPVYKKIIAFFHIDEESFSWKFFLSIKVFGFAAIGNMFFRLSSLSSTIHMMGLAFSEFHPWILFNGSILKLGVSYKDINIIILGTVMLLIASVLREKYTSAREWISKQLFPFRWLIWLMLFVLTLIYGMYGPGYSASEFIYRGF